MADGDTNFGNVLNFGKIGSVGQGFAGAVQDIYAAEGDITEGKLYTEAAGLAGANEQYTALSTAIKEAQTNREIYQTIGAQQAGYAGGNIAASGSALDVLRSSIAQGGIAKYTLAEQGAIQESAYEEQKQSYEKMADAASNAATGAYIAAGINAFTGATNLVSPSGLSNLLTSSVGTVTNDPTRIGSLY